MDDLINYLFTFNDFCSVYAHAKDELTYTYNIYLDTLEFKLNNSPDKFYDLGGGFHFAVNTSDFSFSIVYDTEKSFNY